MPGQTSHRRGRLRRDELTSMEGRTIARPNLLAASWAMLMAILQWRAGQLPGQTVTVTMTDSTPTALQWRAGQLPGQTVQQLVHRDARELTSMEGRTIARPNKVCVTGAASCVFTSMEGRTIARPNWAGRASRSRRRRHFNGGPDNCPAKPVTRRGVYRGGHSLQWRAGQLPGQTSSGYQFPCCSRLLQWRAGQLPGQTHPPPAHTAPEADTSMEGRTIARPNRPRGVVGDAHGHTSMEGRTIARPNSPTCAPSR